MSEFEGDGYGGADDGGDEGGDEGGGGGDGDEDEGVDAFVGVGLVVFKAAVGVALVGAGFFAEVANEVYEVTLAFFEAG